MRRDDIRTSRAFERILSRHAIGPWRNRRELFDGLRAGIDPREGWIAGPGTVELPEGAGGYCSACQRRG